METGLDAQEFSLKDYLLSYVRKVDDPEGAADKGSPSLEIDYIRIEPQVVELHEIQKQACEDIVEVVDGHLDTFCQISSRLATITDRLAQTETLYYSTVERVE